MKSKIINISFIIYCIDTHTKIKRNSFNVSNLMVKRKAHVANLNLYLSKKYKGLNIYKIMTSIKYIVKDYNCPLHAR